MKAFISGPMRGIQNFNFPAFDHCATVLRSWGWEVRNPAERDRRRGFDETAGHLDGFDLHAAMHWDIACVLWAETVVLLPGWRDSAGAAVELAVADAVGCRVLEWDPTTEKVADRLPESPLGEADRIVSGARQQAYGHPFDDFTRTGRMWGAILGTSDVDPALVGLCLLAVKISREVNRPKRDNRVDMAGYAKTVDLIEERKASDGR